MFESTAQLSARSKHRSQQQQQGRSPVARQIAVYVLSPLIQHHALPLSSAGESGATASVELAGSREVVDGFGPFQQLVCNQKTEDTRGPLELTLIIETKAGRVGLEQLGLA